MTDDSYRITEEERKPFAEHWCIGDEKTFPHGVFLQIAIYNPTSPDGQLVTVECSAWPGRFYRLETPTLKITTGSGQEMRELAARLAEALSQGMLSIIKH